MSYRGIDETTGGDIVKAALVGVLQGLFFLGVMAAPIWYFREPLAVGLLWLIRTGRTIAAYF